MLGTAHDVFGGAIVIDATAVCNDLRTAFQASGEHIARAIVKPGVISREFGVAPLANLRSRNGCFGHGLKHR